MTRKETLYYVRFPLYSYSETVVAADSEEDAIRKARLKGSFPPHADGYVSYLRAR